MRLSLAGADPHRGTHHAEYRCLMDKLPAFRVKHQTVDNMRKDPQLFLLERLSPQ
jgi:hypothetical protein